MIFQVFFFKDYFAFLHIKKIRTMQFLNTLLSQNRNVYFFLFILAFVLYGNTLQHQYALDDAIVITENDFVQKGVSGIPDILTTDVFTGFFGVKKNLVEGGRYRPLSLVSFAVENEIFGNNPFVSHLINILLYALNSILLFSLLSILFKETAFKEQTLYLPLVVTVLWMLHPLHTEVVANIKGRDEILALLGSLWSLKLIFKYLSEKKISLLISANLIFFLALISKETTITFLAVIPLSLWFFRTYSFKEILIPVGSLMLPTIIFLILRQSIMNEPALTGMSVPKELMNDSFLNATFNERYATVFFTLLLYIKLLFVPYPLTFDYYPYHIELTSFSNIYVILSLLIHLALAIAAIWGIRKKSLISFGILYYAVTFSIVSNLLFPIGTFMSERFMYMPSIGWALILGYLMILLSKKFNQKGVLTTLVLVVAVPSTVLSISRNQAWENDYVLFTTDVKTSVNGAKSNTSAGGKIIEECDKLEKILKDKPNNIKALTKALNASLLTEDEKHSILTSNNVKEVLNNTKVFRQNHLQKAKSYLRKAIEVHPTYIDALLLLGNACFKYNRDMDSTWLAYEKILKINPAHPLAIKNWTLILNDSIPYIKKVEYHKKLLKYNPNLFENTYQVGHIYGRYLNQLDSSIVYLEKAASLDSKKAKVYKDLGVAYGINKQYKKALDVMLKAKELDPSDNQILINIGVTYQMLGDEKKASEYFLMSKKK